MDVVKSKRKSQSDGKVEIRSKKLVMEDYSPCWIRDNHGYNDIHDELSDFVMDFGKIHLNDRDFVGNQGSNHIVGDSKKST